MENISGNYKIKIYKADKSPEFIICNSDIYIAEIVDNNKNTFCTSGNYDEIFYMIGDVLATAFDINIPNWKRFIIRLFNLP